MNDADHAGGGAPPSLNRRQARTVMNDAFALLQQGTGQLTDGQDLLQQASRGEAWRALGYQSWDECLLEYAARAKGQLPPTQQARRGIVTALMNTGLMSRRAISRALGVSSSVILKDLTAAEQAGLLDPEAVRRRESLPRRPISGGPRRRDLLKSWRTAVHDLGRRTRALQEMCMDNRYGDRMEDLKVSSRADLQQAADILVAILKDFDRDDDNHHKEN